MNTTISVGAFEAKTKFSELLERVNRGEEIIITRHDKPVARLVPFARSSRSDIREAFRQLDEIRGRHRLNPSGKEKMTYRQLIEEGRRR
jgi:prevent-host-death family protein